MKSIVRIDSIQMDGSVDNDNFEDDLFDANYVMPAEKAKRSEYRRTSICPELRNSDAEHWWYRHVDSLIRAEVFMATPEEPGGDEHISVAFMKDVAKMSFHGIEMANRYFNSPVRLDGWAAKMNSREQMERLEPALQRLHSKYFRGSGKGGANESNIGNWLDNFEQRFYAPFHGSVNIERYHKYIRLKLEWKLCEFTNC